MRIKDKLGLRFVWTTHDDGVWVVPIDGHEQETYEAIREEMERPPTWLPDLPLKVEGGVSERYEK